MFLDQLCLGGRFKFFRTNKNTN
jgi:hypothetical protein